MASDGVTVVAVMTLVNHLWFLLSPENSFRDILTVTQEKRNYRRQPHLDHPQVFLDHRPREEVQRLVAAKTNGATPLVLSCRSHHLSSPATGQPVFT